MANKDTSNRPSGKPKQTAGPGIRGMGSYNDPAITRSGSGGVYNTGDWRTRMGAQNGVVANNGRTGEQMMATGSTKTSPEVSLEYTDAKAVNKALSANSGTKATNVAGDRKGKKNLY